MNNLYLSDLENIKFIELHNLLLPKRNKKFDSISFNLSQIKNKDIEYLKVPIKELFILIINKTVEILNYFNKNNYDISNCFIEFQQRNCGFEKKKYEVFSWHKDDYTNLNSKVYTVIFYLRKDKTIINGNLKYIKNGKVMNEEIKEKKILCFNGSLKHKPEICEGFGCRDIIVVFVKRN